MGSTIEFPKDDSNQPCDAAYLVKLPLLWKAVRFRHLFSFGKGLNITKENLQESGIPCVNYGEVHSKYGFEITPQKHALKYVSEDYLKKSKRSLLSKGDFVFADTSEDIEGSGNFTQLISEDIIFAGYHTVICRPIGENNHRYLAYFIDSRSFRNQIRRAVKGVKVYSITKTILKNTNLCLPEIEEQVAIATFLDQKISQIDEAIAIKDQQIALLKERKQIIIQKAVTKGLDPNVAMKASRVNWIGEIPEHWEVKRLKYVLEERNERSKTGKEPLLMVSQVHGLVVRSEYHDKAEVSATNVDNKIVYKNDLVFNKLKAHLGVFFKSNIEFKGLVSPDYAVYKAKAYIEDLKILELLFRNPKYIEQFIIRATGVVEGLIRLYTGDLFDISVPVAPLEEQRLILEFIADESKKFDIAINIQKSQIELLKEYKITLINSAVTGKIKVA